MTERRITAGKWHAGGNVITVHGRGVIAETPLVSGGGVFERSTNNKFIALAGTTANELYDLGYDPFVVLERLPEILAEWRALIDCYCVGSPPDPTVRNLQPHIMDSRALLTTLTREGGE